jgi:four helix bundle protein
MTNQTPKGKTADRITVAATATTQRGDNMNARECKARPPFDLEEQTARFGEAILRFAKTLPLTAVTTAAVRQLTRSGTSVGANYCEADDAGSKREFRHRISICRRESRETKYWLRMIATAAPEAKAAARPLWQEAKELHLIFGAIFRKAGQREASKG